MPEYLQTTIDKFTFRVATDRLYTPEGLWVLAEGAVVRVGLSDFLQQRSGDVAFAEIRPAGTLLAVGEELATIETIKVNIELAAPVAGKILDVNPALSEAPEAINQDPYGAGWLAVIAPAEWEAQRARLLEAQAYFKLMKGQAETEAKG